MSQKFALDFILNTYIAVLETLENIWEDYSDKKSALEIGGFFSYMQSKRIIYTAFCFKNILSTLEPVSKLLQRTTLACYQLLI